MQKKQDMRLKKWQELDAVDISACVCLCSKKTYKMHWQLSDVTPGNSQDQS